jgi:hypothetical protein
MVQRVLQENLRRKRPLGKSRLRWENGIKRDLLSAREVDYEDMDGKEVAENRRRMGEDLFYGKMVSKALKKKKQI